jgi:hypothetical protein
MLIPLCSIVTPVVEKMSRGAENGGEPVYDLGTRPTSEPLAIAVGYGILLPDRLLPWWRGGVPCVAAPPQLRLQRATIFHGVGVGGVPLTWRDRRRAPESLLTAIKSRRRKDPPILITVSAVTPLLIHRLHAPDLLSRCRARSGAFGNSISTTAS